MRRIFCSYISVLVTLLIIYNFKFEFYTQKLRRFLDGVSMVLYVIQLEYTLVTQTSGMMWCNSLIITCRFARISPSIPWRIVFRNQRWPTAPFFVVNISPSFGEFTAPLRHTLPIHNVTINSNNLFVNFRLTFTFCVEKSHDGTHLEFGGTLDRRCHFKLVSLKQSLFYHCQTNTAHR